MKSHLFGLVLVLSAFSSHGLLTGAEPSQSLPLISVDASKSLGPVNRHVFGNNIEAADGRGIFSEKLNAEKYDIGGIKFGQGYWNPELRRSNPEIVAATKDIGIGMLRYPGGCLVHNFDWRKAVGPLSERGDWQFGIDEYIQLCRDLNAEPLFTVTDYALPAEELPRHAAELVEYLNSPATPEHPWAMKRKEWGHPAPYGVKWFELGNESDHGNHKCLPSRRYTPAEYVAYAKACAAAMKKVDPTIKVGVLTVPGAGVDYDCMWNMAVYKEACPIADFLIVHYYGPNIDEGMAPEACFKAAMAYGDKLEWRMKQYSDLCEKLSGRKLPLAVTEYNIFSIKDKPVPYRFSFTAGLLCADMMRIYLNPSSNVANAENWQVSNGFWGMFRCKDGKITKRTATLPFFQMWGRHFGDTMVSSEVAAFPRFEAPAFSAKGDSLVPSVKLCDVNLPPFDLTKLNAKGISAESAEPTSLSVHLKDYDKESYLDFSKFARPAAVPAGSAFWVKLSFEARFIPDDSAKKLTASLGIGMIDSRGWEKVKSGTAINEIQSSTEWFAFNRKFETRSDCPGISLHLRVLDVSGPISGKLELRNIKAEIDSQMVFPAYKGLTTSSSLSKDGKTLYLMVFNKSLDTPIETKIALKNFNASSMKSWTLTQDNVASIDYVEPRMDEAPFTGTETLRVFPAHSMTAIEFKR